MVSVTTTQLCHCSVREAKYNTHTSGYAWIPINFVTEQAFADPCLNPVAFELFWLWIIIRNKIYAIIQNKHVYVCVCACLCVYIDKIIPAFKMGIQWYFLFYPIWF